MPALSSYKTPGVYVDEVQKLPPSIAQVATAIPVFIGYTEKAERDGDPLIMVPTRVTSLDQYVRWFGGPYEEKISISLEGDDQSTIKAPRHHEIKFRMYYAVQMFFENGGGICHIISVGKTLNDDGTEANIAHISAPEGSHSLADGIELLYKLDEGTLIVFPDAVGKSSDAVAADATPPYIGLYQQALTFCADDKINNYFVLMDVAMTDLSTDTPIDDANTFRNAMPSDTNLTPHGAAYYPFVATLLAPSFTDDSITITGLPAEPAPAGNGNNGNGGNGNAEGEAAEGEETNGEGEEGAAENGEGAAENENANGEKTLASIKASNNQLYNQIRAVLSTRTQLVLPLSGIMAGVYARVDAQSGVFKAPANVGLSLVSAPTTKVADKDHDNFNVDTQGGKSINVIRTFTGRGTLVWGARTLSGNDREWKYVSVRRFFNMVEESVKRALFRFVFEPNNPNTWLSIRASIEAFLETQWRAGALLGNTTNDAFFVRVGVPETFTEAEMLDGYMVVEIGMAVVRPAEFIVLKFMHKFDLGQS